MRCRRAQKLVSRRMDGALPSDDAAALDLHLVRCAACRFAAERLERAWRALAPAGQAVAAPDDWARIEAGVEGRSGKGMPLPLRWQIGPAPAAAACALVVMAALGATGGVLLSRAAFAPRRADSIEASVISETLGDLPWGSPAAGLAGFLADLDTRVPQEKSQ